MATIRNEIRGVGAAREVTAVMGIHLPGNVQAGRWRVCAVDVRTLSM